MRANTRLPHEISIFSDEELRIREAEGEEGDAPAVEVEE
jgi:hypothetical protein